MQNDEALNLTDTERRIAHDMTRRHFFEHCSVGLARWR